MDYIHKSMVSCQKGPNCHAYAWQIGPFWQDTLKISSDSTNGLVTDKPFSKQRLTQFTDAKMIVASITNR